MLCYKVLRCSGKKLCNRHSKLLHVLRRHLSQKAQPRCLTCFCVTLPDTSNPCNCCPLRTTSCISPKHHCHVPCQEQRLLQHVKPRLQVTCSAISCSSEVSCSISTSELGCSSPNITALQHWMVLGFPFTPPSPRVDTAESVVASASASFATFWSSSSELLGPCSSSLMVAARSARGILDRSEVTGTPGGTKPHKQPAHCRDSKLKHQKNKEHRYEFVFC